MRIGSGSPVCWNPRIHQVELFLVEREAQARGLVHVGGDDGRLSGFRVDLPSALRLTTLTPRLTLPNWLDMSSDPTHAVARQDLAFEMAHVLFLDIVAYSRLPMEQQAGVLHRLQELVRQTPEFPRAQKTHRLITLPTGDGMALVFFNDPEAPARCAVELAQAIRAEPGLELRMGIHTGPVYRVADINANRNVAGGGINLAQRVMDCGDGGHILVSQSVADVLGHLDVWKNTLHDLGEAEVKHGVRIHLYNLYTDQAGNSVLPRKLRDAQEATRLARSRVRRRRMWLALAVAGTLMLAVAAAFLMRPHPLTEKDTLVLADFSNNTGDPVFNDALKQGLAVELEQSPFLNILSEDRVSQQLRYMGHSVDDHVTPEIAQEVCRREGSKAMLLGSIASLGSHYVIGLKAVNCRNGDSLGKEQVEAERREDVLAKLHEAGTRLRNKLGESLTSIQKYDTPLEQATTSSLEALQAYSMAMKIWRSKQDSAAIPLLKRAVEVDPHFALAYADLGVMYVDLGEADSSAEYAKKAYELRERVTERERFSIDSTYYQLVTGELEKAAQVNEQRKQTYPRDLAPYITLGLIDSYMGKLEPALAQDLEAMQLRPDTARVYENLSYDYLSLDRLPEAKAVLEAARAKKLDESLLPNLYQLAFLENDDRGMSTCVSAGLGTGNEDALLSSQADTEAFHGRLGRARDLSHRAVAAALREGTKETAATWQATAALREAEFGNAAQARQQAVAALALSSSRDVRVAVAMALARAGDLTRAKTMVNDLYGDFHSDTLLVNYWLPSIRAAIALGQENAPLAIGFLQVTAAYELGGGIPPFSSGATMYPVYLRGQAYLGQQKWSEAAAEFTKIREHRGLVWNFPIGALTPVMLGRAHAGQADFATAKSEYRDFLDLWQAADSDVPILRAAQSESAKLK
jgi:class 3 adenylate cyclase/tetratricopeptide (TPR) repeat protein